ncbi:hypothetical protein AAG570_007845 [Ranatra chinensis]|uniref:Uncharacterized protein n=1 Tax=Ranatra chinensis TaxID=642074 RepID=A0ABD0XT00_9HEMI
MCWIPVPKKTYWPVVGTPRQESSASLSVSDDNSSIQSSPWQRDHCWKQTTPRQNISQELEFNMVRPSCLRKLRYTSQAVRAKRRKPSDMTTVDQSLMVKVRVKLCKRNPLDGVIQTLWERVVNSSKSEPGIVSPRKRILRELERVTLEEATKRQRARPPARTANSHSISAILAREDESVLRTLLRSPSPSADIARTQQPRVPASPYIPSSHSLHSSYSSSSSSSSTSAHHSLWPVHYPVSSPSLPLPLYPVPPYHTSHWAHMYRSVPQDTSPGL